jgi:hypothetical protein
MKIHTVIGTTPKDLLEKYRKQSSHMDLIFSDIKDGCGIEKLLPRE